MLIPAQDANKIKHNVIETFFTMELQLFGINHKTSNVAEREKFIINESNQILLDSHLKKLFGNDFESFFGISTCNRTEIYLVGRPGISKHIFKESHKSLKIGITGPPGAGKSSLMNKLIPLVRKENLSVGVIAIDPSSPITGGSFLGDRVRINNAVNDIASGIASTVLVINPEISTPFVNYTKRDIHFIFGDGCVATVVSKNNTSNNGFKVLDRKLITKFSNNIRSDWSYLARAASDEKSYDDLLFYQNGNSVFKEVCPMVAKFINNQLEENNLKADDIKKFWLHQANARMVNLIVSKIIGSDDFDTSLAPLPIEKYGNLASAGSMFAFNLHNDLQSGEKGLICSFGAGYSVCSIIVEKI